MTAPADTGNPAPPRPTTPPRRWKIWVLTCIVIYPIITLLGYILEDTTATLPIWAHFLIMVPLAVALLVFIVMPALTKRFAKWLTR